MKRGLQQARTEHIHKTPTVNPVHIPSNSPLSFLFCSSLLALCSEQSHGYGGDDGQANNCVASAVDLWDSEALANVPPLI